MEVSDDGLFAGTVGRWAEDKHKLVALYAKLFSTGMKDKWDERVYIELYSGAGYSRIKDTSRIIAGSPLRALALEHPFDKYIFCEMDGRALEALRIRVEKTAPWAKTAYIGGDCNERIGEILAQIPAHSQGHRVLSLCFVDPFDIGIKFKTLRRLSERFVDFVVLLALHMDANRNYERYLKEDAVKIDEFLGSGTWRDRWTTAQNNVVGFPQFLAIEFASSMESLKYLPTPLHRMKLVKSDEKNLPLYYVAMFSRNERAHKFWDDVLKYSTDQAGFGWD